ncbi:S8 family peptidase [uncultured Nostoc sp.]|uniref:S8 family peptidase n=1 Tax=uncultured Nostoc sp. TaxID=340711 RepID=UPI0035CB7620
MVESSQGFPHITLRLTTEGRAASLPGALIRNPITVANLGNRQEHGNKLKVSIETLIFDWQDTQEKREEKNKSKVLYPISLILKIDPSYFDADRLRTFGIEVIAELEDGYILGISLDIELSEFQKKIEKFINKERGGNKIAEIWEIIDGSRRPEYILAQDLIEHWNQVKDDQIYTVDVGLSCIGNKDQFTDYPVQKTHESNYQFIQRVNNWINQRNLSYEQWDNIKSEIEEQFLDFVQDKTYNGVIIKNIDGHISKSAHIPDCFLCRIQISGKGIKDLVFSFPYIFDVSEPNEFLELLQKEKLYDSFFPLFQLEPPELNAPKVCIIDSGIQERHPLLKAAIDSVNSISWVTGEINKTADYVNGGHGTSVAGAVLYPRTIPRTEGKNCIFWIQNARVLDEKCKLPKQLFPPNLLDEIVGIYQTQAGTRLFNHSINASVPCRTRYMSAWASAIDNLTWQNDILFIVSAGNLPLDGKIGFTRLSVKEHLAANRIYPDYLLDSSCRIADPAQSFQALTVGSIASISYNLPPYSSISQSDKPSAFSCSGLGIWKTIKPEVVEYGGDLVKDEATPPNITFPKDVCPELVRSTLNGGPAIGADKVGTSFAVPKVSHIAARLAAELPNESCLLYRALIVQSARWPEWIVGYGGDKLHILRQIGYGLPDVDRALGNAPNRITLMTTGERRIVAKQAHIYQVKLPEKLRSQGEAFKILLEVTLSYKAQPRRTRRNRRKYLSTWLDWECSKKGEDPELFKARVLEEFVAPEDVEKGEGLFKWMLGKQNHHGIIKGVSRSAGTLQKDWAVVNSFELTEAFSIAVVGHEGWNNDPEASVPYSLVISFEAIQTDVSIYTSIVEAQVETEIEPLIEVQSIVGN